MTLNICECHQAFHMFEARCKLSTLIIRNIYPPFSLIIIFWTWLMLEMSVEAPVLYKILLFCAVLFLVEQIRPNSKFWSRTIQTWYICHFIFYFQHSLSDSIEKKILSFEMKCTFFFSVSLTTRPCLFLKKNHSFILNLDLFQHLSHPIHFAFGSRWLYCHKHYFREWLTPKLLC